MASIEPPKGIAKARYRQPALGHLPSCPARGLICGPSGGGKGVLVHQMIMQLYRGVFDHIHYWSASADLDPSLQPITKMCKEELGQDECLHNEFDENEITEIINKQRKMITAARKRNDGEYLPQLLIVIDDFGDQENVARGKLLTSLFVRGRHMGISTWVLTQKLRLIGSAIRVNQTFMICFRLRSFQDLAAVIEENSALVPQKTLRELYDAAVEQPYQFLYIDLQAKTLAETFYRSFEARLVVR